MPPQALEGTLPEAVCGHARGGDKLCVAWSWGNSLPVERDGHSHLPSYPCQSHCLHLAGKRLFLARGAQEVPVSGVIRRSPQGGCTRNCLAL